MIAVPAGVYPISAGADATFERGLGSAREELAAYRIDRTEVTNAEYRACYEAGACPWPAEIDSATRTNYFLDPAYADYPVVQVEWESAQSYCAWKGKRLPTAAEWEVAATWAPATARSYRYPWGETWEPALVIGGGGFVDTAPVGSRSPQGNSPLGVADISGNVMEWTGSAVASYPRLVMIKGGSWRDSPGRLLPSAFHLIRKTAASNAVGFRCAASQ
jgi:formylglycine-generating enzyme required for sulfatase activity